MNDWKTNFALKILNTKYHIPEWKHTSRYYWNDFLFGLKQIGLMVLASLCFAIAYIMFLFSLKGHL